MQKLTDFDMSGYLDNQEAIMEYLSQVLEKGDQDEFLRALGYIVKVKGMTQISKETGLTIESLDKTFQKGADPEFSTIVRVMNAIGFTLQIK